MIFFKLTTLAIFSITSLSSYAQKTISDGTINYSLSSQSENKTSQSDPLSGATNTIYLKGLLSRTDMVSTLGKETTIFDAKSGTGVILKEYSGQKLMITLTKDNWANQNKKFDGIVFTTTAETKTIANFSCKKAIGKLKDGSEIIVFYAPDLIINNKEYNQTFKNLPGLPIEYEFKSGNLKFIYLLTGIDFGVVSSAKFDFPKSGYRVISYDENKKGKSDN